MNYSRRFLIPIAIATVATAQVAVAADALPAGWKPLTDVRKTCKIAVPADWTLDLSTAYSPGKKISATVHGMAKDDSWDSSRSMVKSMFAPIKVMQDDGKRLLYTMNPGAVAPGKSGWYALINTSPVCTLSFTFPAGSDEALLKQIADTLAAAK